MVQKTELTNLVNFDELNIMETNFGFHMKLNIFQFNFGHKVCYASLKWINHRLVVGKVCDLVMRWKKREIILSGLDNLVFCSLILQDGSLAPIIASGSYDESIKYGTKTPIKHKEIIRPKNRIFNEVRGVEEVKQILNWTELINIITRCSPVINNKKIEWIEYYCYCSQ